MKRTVQQIISDMTIDEKLRQLTQLTGSFLASNAKSEITGPMNQLQLTHEDLNQLGSTLGSGNPDAIREMQKTHMSADRNRIPLLFMRDIIHGFRTVYPVPLGMAASFSPDLFRECAAMAARFSSVSVRFGISGVRKVCGLPLALRYSPFCRILSLLTPV